VGILTVLTTNAAKLASFRHGLAKALTAKIVWLAISVIISTTSVRNKP